MSVGTWLAGWSLLMERVFLGLGVMGPFHGWYNSLRKGQTLS